MGFLILMGFLWQDVYLEGPLRDDLKAIYEGSLYDTCIYFFVLLCIPEIPELNMTSFLRKYSNFLLKLFVLDFWNDLNEISGMGRQKRKKEKNVRNNKLDVKSTQNGGEFKFGPTQTEQSRGLSLPMSYPCCMPQLFCWLKEGKSFGFYEIQSETVYLPCRKLERNVESLKYFANWIIVV